MSEVDRESCRAVRWAGFNGVRHRLGIMNGAFMSFLQFYVQRARWA